MKLYTIGYQGRTIEEVVNLLWDYDIRVLIDVRHKPRSRIKDLSEKPLKKRLEGEGLAYACLYELGVPSDARRDLCVEEIKQYYDGILSSNEGVLRLINLLIDEGVAAALLCFERDYHQCHRQWIAEKLQQMNPDLKVVHL